MAKKIDPKAFGQMGLFDEPTDGKTLIPYDDFMSIFRDGYLGLLPVYATLFYGKKITVVCEETGHELTLVVTGTLKGRVTEVSVVRKNFTMDLHHRYPRYPYCDT